MSLDRINSKNIDPPNQLGKKTSGLGEFGSSVGFVSTGSICTGILASNRSKMKDSLLQALQAPMKHQNVQDAKNDMLTPLKACIELIKDGENLDDLKEYLQGLISEVEYCEDVSELKGFKGYWLKTSETSEMVKDSLKMFNDQFEPFLAGDVGHGPHGLESNESPPPAIHSLQSPLPPPSEKPSINDLKKGLFTCLPTQNNTLPNKFSAAVRSQLAKYSMVTVRDVKDLLNSDSFKGISNRSIKAILIRDLSKVMVPEIGLGADVSAFDDFLGLIKEDPFKRCFSNEKLSRMTTDAFHYQAQVIGDARGSGLYNQDIPRFHGVCLQHFAEACEAQSIGADDTKGAETFTSVAGAARRSVTTQQQVSLMDKTVSKDEWKGVLDSHFSDADHLFLTGVGIKEHNVALTINKREDGKFSLIVINLGYGSRTHGQVNSYTVPNLDDLAGTLKLISDTKNKEDKGMNAFYGNLKEKYGRAIPLPCPFHEQYSGDCGSRNPQVGMVYAFPLSDIANKTVVDPDGPYQKTIEFIKFDSKKSAENMTVDSAEKRHMLSAAVTHYKNVTTSLLELCRMDSKKDSFKVNDYRQKVRALCVKIAMDPQNISVDLRELKDICSDLEPSNKYLYKDGYRFSLGTILSDVNSYDLNSNTTANNTNLKSVQQQLFELAKPSDVLESKSLEDLLAEKTESYSSARSFF